MTRIYQGGGADRRFQSEKQSRAYNPNKVVGREKQIRQEGAAAQQDFETQDRERQRGDALEDMERQMKNAADTLDLKQLQQEQAAKFKQEQTKDAFELVNQQQLEKNALSLELQYDKNTLANKQLVDKNSLVNQQFTSKAAFDNQQLSERATLSYNQLVAQNTLKSDQLDERQALEKQRMINSANAQREQAWMQAKHATERAALSKQRAGVTALLAFADIGLKATAMAVEYNQKKKQEQESLEFFGSDGVKIIQPDGTVNPIVQRDEAKTAAVSATEDGVQAVATRDGLTGVEADVIRRPAANYNNGRTVQQIGVAEAATQIGPVLQDSWNKGVKVQLPDGRILDPQLIDNAIDAQAYGKAIVGDFVTKAGLKDMDAAAVVKTLYPTAVNQVNAFTNQKGAQIAASNIQRTKDLATEKAAMDLAAGQLPLQEVWDNISSGYYGSGGYMNNRAGANEAALKALIPYLSVDQLEQLKSVQKVNGNKGTKLGVQYGPLIEQAIRQERRGDISDRQLDYQEDTLTVKDAKAAHTEALLNAQNPEQVQQAHTAYEATLLNNGSPAALEEYQNQININNNRNPFAIGTILENAAQGQPLSAAEGKALVDDGTLSPAEYKAAVEAGAIIGLADTKALASVKADVKAGVTAAVTNIAQGVDTGIPTGDKVADRELALIINDLNDQATAALSDFIAANPGVPDGAKREFIRKWAADNIPGKLQGISWNPETGTIDGYTFSGTAPGTKTEAATTTYKNPVTGNQSRVLSTLTTTQLSDLQTDDVTKNDINPVDDRLLTQAELQAAVGAITKGAPVPARVKAIAEIAGLTPKALAIYQGMGQGIDVAGLFDQAEGARLQSSAGPSNLEGGAKYLKAEGYSAKGAAYLAANIQQESGWNGQRSWGAVFNPSTGQSDGTSRNGGLVSWASWTDDPARLGNIENYLGKPIEQATHAEQIAAMNWEMKKYYPDAYRIFNNPNATDAQLRRASYQYWGYGHEGKNRFGSFLRDAKRAVGVA